MLALAFVQAQHFLAVKFGAHVILLIEELDSDAYDVTAVFPQQSNLSSQCVSYFLPVVAISRSVYSGVVVPARSKISRVDTKIVTHCCHKMQH